MTFSLRINIKVNFRVDLLNFDLNNSTQLKDSCLSIFRWKPVIFCYLFHSKVYFYMPNVYMTTTSEEIQNNQETKFGEIFEYGQEGRKFIGRHALWRGVSRPNFLLDVKADRNWEGSKKFPTARLSTLIPPNFLSALTSKMKFGLWIFELLVFYQIFYRSGFFYLRVFNKNWNFKQTSSSL